MMKPWEFDVPPETAVVTTSYVTERGMPILYVSHEFDEEEGIIWQFHCGNGDFRPTVLQLVRLDEILKFDARIAMLATLPLGFHARRVNADTEWIVERDSR